MGPDLLRDAQRRARVTITEWARRAGTSRPTVSAYVNGRTIPRLDTTERLLDTVDLELRIGPAIRREVRTTSAGRSVTVLSAFPRLAARDAFEDVRLPDGESIRGRSRFDLHTEADRITFYEYVLKRSLVDEIERCVDAVLVRLVWDELVIPPDVKAEWQPSLARS